jgi:hypothetical protein
MVTEGTRKSWLQIIRWKLLIAVIAGAALWYLSGLAGFPPHYQNLFASYALLGFVVYTVLDAPPLSARTGWQAGLMIAVFYIIISVGYVVAGNFLPQFISQDEVEGIERKTSKFKQDPALTETLTAKANELSERADQIVAKLNTIRLSGGAASEELEFVKPQLVLPNSLEDLTAEEIIELGSLVYQDYECYNCHKIGGKGGKKRGPKLDNIANLATAAQLTDKIFNPEAWMADGYEERTKDKMPDKYPDIMSNMELEALVTYLMTLNDDSVDTPQPIFPDGYSVQ